MAQDMIERRVVDADTFSREVVSPFEPVVLRGQVAGWPAAGGQKAAAIAAYMQGFAQGVPAEVMVLARSFYRLANTLAIRGQRRTR